MSKRRILFWLLVSAFIWLIVSRFSDIRHLFHVMLTGRWEWLAAGFLLQVCYYLTLASLYRSAFSTVEIYTRLRDLLPVVFGSLFMNVVAPSGGASGAALFVDDAARRGESPARAAAGTLLTLISDFTAFSIALIAGLVYLYIQNDLQSYEVIGSIILLGVTFGMSAVLFLGYKSPHRLLRLFEYVMNLGNRMAAVVDRQVKRVFPKRSSTIDPFFSESWAEKNAQEFREAAVAISVHPLRLARTLAIAVLAHIIDLVNLFVLFLAYGEVIHLGPLVAGYAVGILFWIVSITPQGIGVVEGLMSLVYATVGVPAAIATVVTLVFRGLTFWLPLALGFVLLQRLRLFSSGERSRADVWNVRAVAILTGVMGVVNIYSGLTPNTHARMQLLEPFVPLMVRRGGHLTAILAGFALILLAGNLWRRKRVAWAVAMAVLIITVISHLLKGLDIFEAVLAASLAIWLLLLRRHFHARSDPPSVQQGLYVLAAAFIFTLAYGAAGFYLLDRHFHQTFSLVGAVTQTVVMFTQFYDPGLQPLTGFGRFFANSIYVVASATFGYAVFMLARPVLVHGPASIEQRQKAEQIVQSFGRSSLARFTLLSDKSYYFSPGGTLIAYVPRNGVALVLGDPIGPPADLLPAIQAFQQYCAQNDWLLAFYQALPDHLIEYQQLGFQVLCIGHEAIVDLRSFTLEGRANKSLRSSYNHILKLGTTSHLVLPPVPSATLQELRDVSDEWLTSKKMMEMRFSLGWFEDDYVRSTPVMEVIGPDGVVTAFGNLVSEYQRNEIGVDLMRSIPNIENGTMEFLFVSILDWARDAGYETFNLGLSALSGLAESSEVPAIERALHYIYEHVNQFYNFQGLHKFKEKFNPLWSPRYLIYPGAASLPAVALALAMADSGSGFWTVTLKEVINQAHERLFPSPDGNHSGNGDHSADGVHSKAAEKSD